VRDYTPLLPRAGPAQASPLWGFLLDHPILSFPGAEGPIAFGGKADISQRLPNNCDLRVHGLVDSLSAREPLALFGVGAITWPPAARAQQVENPVRIGFLPNGSPSNSYDAKLAWSKIGMSCSMSYGSAASVNSLNW
jgi:hypothetical protein